MENLKEENRSVNHELCVTPLKESNKVEKLVEPGTGDQASDNSSQMSDDLDSAIEALQRTIDIQETLHDGGGGGEKLIEEVEQGQKEKEEETPRNKNVLPMSLDGEEVLQEGGDKQEKMEQEQKEDTCRKKQEEKDVENGFKENAAVLQKRPASRDMQDRNVIVKRTSAEMELHAGREEDPGNAVDKVSEADGEDSSRAAESGVATSNSGNPNTQHNASQNIPSAKKLKNCKLEHLTSFQTKYLEWLDNKNK